MKRRFILLSALAAALGNAAMAQVSVTDPWARAALEHQPITGAYMQLLSKEDARLIAAHSTAAREVGIHEMKMENGVMKMRQVDHLDLPAGRPVALKPGGFHIMLTGLKRQIKEGEMMPLVLEIEDRKGKRQRLELNVPVRSLTGSHKH